MANVEASISQPAIQPIGSDYKVCSATLGRNVLAGHCRRLVNTWDESDFPLRYYLHESNGQSDRPEGSAQLPLTFEYGACTVGIQSAGPPTPGADSEEFLTASSNELRGIARNVIDECTSIYRQGGYQTRGLGDAIRNIISIEDSPLRDLNQVYTTPIEHLESWKYLTITVRHILAKDQDKSPSDYDQMVPFMIEYEANQASAGTQDAAAKRYLDRLGRYYYETGLDMLEGEGDPSPDTWWGRNTATTASNHAVSSGELQSIQQAENMDYDCDPKLGQPKPADCEHLLDDGQLGMETDADIEIAPNNPQIYTYGTCALSLAATLATQISWRAIRIAIEALVSVCLYRPYGAIGGRAHPRISSKGKSKRVRQMVKREAPEINGNNALPEHIQISMWSHDPLRYETECEWQRVEQGVEVDNPGCRS